MAKRIFGTILAFFCCVTLTAVTLDLAVAGVVARVDGAEINDEDVKLALEDIGRTLPQQMSPAQRQAYIINYLIDLKLAARKAEQADMAKTADFARKLAYFRQKALMEAYMDGLTRIAVSEQKVQEVYADAAKGHKPEVETKASHILVQTKPEAEAALKRVTAGEDFAKVATEVSKDPGSPGGSLGWFTKDRMVPPFAEMAFKTEVGKISPPVQSQFGWHIIKVEDRRTSAFPKIEQVRPQIEQFLTRRAQSAAIEDLRKSSKIERIEPKK